MPEVYHSFALNMESGEGTAAPPPMRGTFRDPWEMAEAAESQPLHTQLSSQPHTSMVEVNL